jgi:hypothetical protein
MEIYYLSTHKYPIMCSVSPSLLLGNYLELICATMWLHMLLDVHVPLWKAYNIVGAGASRRPHGNCPKRLSPHCIEGSVTCRKVKDSRDPKLRLEGTKTKPNYNLNKWRPRWTFADVKLCQPPCVSKCFARERSLDWRLRWRLSEAAWGVKASQRWTREVMGRRC